MPSRIVRLSLALELAAWIALMAWVREAYSLGSPALVAIALAGALGARIAFLGLTCLLSWVHRSPRAPGQRLGPWGMVRLAAIELRSLLRDNFWYLPFERQALRPDPPHNLRGRTPVVLLHGYFSNRAYWAPLVRWLEAHGVERIYVPTYRAVFSSIELGVEELHREIERLAAGGAHRVVLVCHSMGGLIARGYIQRHGERRIARLVTIASPHHGSALARLGIGEHARQMRPGSAFLAALAAHEAALPPTIPALSIYSVHDNLVAPQETSRLPWARTIAVTGVGHLGLLDHEPVFVRVLEELREAAAA
jgi:pimeloyl-ACP methyl ester carboxylesterase